MRQASIITLCMAGVTGCHGASTKTVESVRYWGAMRTVLAEQQTEARVLLADAVVDSSTYGVGALEGLRGEITIHAGEIWLAETKVGEVVTRRVDGADDHATLLVVGQVDDWQEFVLQDALDADGLERRVRELAEDADVDLTQPFPFVVIGEFIADAHVINGNCPHPDSAAEPLRFRIEGDEAVAVGFYADNSAGTLTHHGTKTHIHVLEPGDSPRTGHVDTIATRPAAILRLPKR